METTQTKVFLQQIQIHELCLQQQQIWLHLQDIRPCLQVSVYFKFQLLCTKSYPHQCNPASMYKNCTKTGFMAQEDEEGEEGIKYKTVFYCIFRFSSNYNVSSSINKQDKKEVIMSEKDSFYFYSPLYFWCKAYKFCCIVWVVAWKTVLLLFLLQSEWHNQKKRSNFHGLPTKITTFIKVLLFQRFMKKITKWKVVKLTWVWTMEF